MRLYDTHCHFERADPTEIALILERAKAVGVEKLMAVGGSSSLNESAALAVEVAAESVVAPQVVCAVGLDRDQVGKTCAPQTPSLKPQTSLRAWGEIGLDYHYSPETREQQLALFADQLEEARRRDLPVVIHTREADDDTVALLREIPSRGIIHCYTGTVEFAKRFLDLGFYISISGIVTFKPAENVREVARILPDDRFLIETDSPFLAPVPMRGNPNEPAFIRHTCEFLANLRGVSAFVFADPATTETESLSRHGASPMCIAEQCEGARRRRPRRRTRCRSGRSWSRRRFWSRLMTDIPPSLIRIPPWREFSAGRTTCPRG